MIEFGGRNPGRSDEMATGITDLLDEALVKMTASEKASLMERIWRSFDQQGQAFVSPAWHGEVLA